MIDSPYPGHNGLRAVGSTRPASEAPDPLPRRDETPTDPDELRPPADEEKTPPDAPGPILKAIADLDKKTDARFKRLESKFARHGRIERGYQLASHALPVFTLLAVAATVCLSFAAVWFSALAYRETAHMRTQPAAIVIEREAPTRGAVLQ